MEQIKGFFTGVVDAAKKNPLGAAVVIGGAYLLLKD